MSARIPWTRLTPCVAGLLILLLAAARSSLAAGVPSVPASLAPPAAGGRPVVVWAAFAVHDINEIDDAAETFDFTGVLVLEWVDPRQAFDPVDGVEERVFQGRFQFDELYGGWFPQLLVVNEAERSESSGVVLRIRPDGTATMIQRITTSAETELDMRWFPFDSHRLEVEFEVLGFDREEVRLQVHPELESLPPAQTVDIPQWSVLRIDSSIRDRPLAYPVAGKPGADQTTSRFVLTIDVDRNSFYIRRLVTIPLIVIVLLSFSVFWMDRSSVGDRMSVSFIGILTGVAYQLLMADVLPRISYFTVIHGFLFVSFVTMGATVVVNLVVGGLDSSGRGSSGDAVDRRCRWIFPVVYFGLIGALLLVATLLF